MKFIQLVLLLSVLLVVATALPFGPKSGVIEATGKNFNNLLKTHKPVFVMFYAPWCGHCKQMHPDYEKFAKSMKGMARIIAVDGDKHRELSQQFGVQGFPTIKYYGFGDKAKAKPQDYQGQRQAGAMTKAAMALVKNDFVTSVKKIADLDTQMGKSTSNKVAILVSNKNTIPPMWAVVAGSNQLNSAKFIFATDKQTDIVKALGVTSFPTIAVVSKDADGAYLKSAYDGAVEYDGIAKFILQELSGTGNAKKASEGAEGSDAPHEEETEAAEKKPAPTPSNPKPALPVKPTALTKYSLEFYCSNKAMKMRGQSPLCVIAASEELDLTDVHAKYSNEPVLFFNAANEDDEVNKILASMGVDTSSTNAKDVLFLRSWKDKSKYSLMKAGDDLDSYVSKVLEGSVTMQKGEKFPSL